MISDFDDLPREAKRRILEQRLQQYYEQAWSWFVDAETIRRQKVSSKDEQAKQQRLDASLANAKQHLECMYITRDLIEEYASDDEQISSENVALILENLQRMRAIDSQDKD